MVGLDCSPFLFTVLAGFSEIFNCCNLVDLIAKNGVKFRLNMCI